MGKRYVTDSTHGLTLGAINEAINDNHCVTDRREYFKEVLLQRKFELIEKQTDRSLKSAVKGPKKHSDCMVKFYAARDRENFLAWCWIFDNNN